MGSTSYKTDSLLGTALVASMVTGAGGILAAVAAALSGEWVGAGICLLAAALAFGSASNALLRR